MSSRKALHVSKAKSFTTVCDLRQHLNEHKLRYHDIISLEMCVIRIFEKENTLEIYLVDKDVKENFLEVKKYLIN